MPSNAPEGTVAPANGSLPESVVDGALDRDFGVYIHVPYCRVRCGYCDFNTYTASELGEASRDTYSQDALKELSMAASTLSHAGLPARPVSTVFFGGGTPTLLPAAELVSMLDGVTDAWGLHEGAEVTTEANPDSVTAEDLQILASGGFTRLSVGMQSAVPHVLKTLDRTHRPEAIPVVIQAAKDAGMQTSLDLIYGTPGETLDDWKRSVDVALANEPDHISAYALIVEPGTKLARQIRRGEVASPDDDLHADMYRYADEAFRGAGYNWYEISNWSTGTDTRSRHNLSYWTGQDWWAIGPGAHSHVGGVRWWNVKHPAAYTQRVVNGLSPAHEREVLTNEDQRVEGVLLRTRIVDGLPIEELDQHGKSEIPALIAEGLIDGKVAIRGRVVPTLHGRLLADTLVHRLLGHVR